jgi:uncharacterized membrane protein YvlD (DUF360 family)
VPLATCFAALRLNIATGWKGSAAFVAALLAHVICLMMQPDFLAAYFQIGVLFLLGIAGQGARRPKVLLVAVSGFFSCLPLLSILGSPHQLSRMLATWAPQTDPYGQGYPLAQMTKAFRAAGLWGAQNFGAALPLKDRPRLVLPNDIGTNALPYLSLLWGNIATGVCIAPILTLLGMLFKNILRQRHLPLRNVLLGLWGFVTIGQSWSIAAPFGLPPLSDAYGTAFLGGGVMGSLMLLIAPGCAGEADRNP